MLDAHLEELVKECKEEVNLIPLMSGARVAPSITIERPTTQRSNAAPAWCPSSDNRPWDVPSTYTVGGCACLALH